MRALWKELRPQLTAIAAFSFFINLLFLVPAIFTLQVFDRVLSSRQPGNAGGAAGGAGVALLVLMGSTMCATGCRTCGQYHGRTSFAAGGECHRGKTARAPDGASTEGIRDVAALRGCLLRTA